MEIATIGATSLERAIIRATTHRRLQPGAAFVLNNIEVQLLSPIVSTAGGRGVKMWLRARNATTLVLLPMDNPYRFINPPVKTPNGTWRVLGDGTEVENTEERPMEVMKQMVYEAVTTRARQLGWVG